MTFRINIKYDDIHLRTMEDSKFLIDLHLFSFLRLFSYDWNCHSLVGNHNTSVFDRHNCNRGFSFSHQIYSSKVKTFQYFMWIWNYIKYFVCLECNGANSNFFKNRFIVLFYCYKYDVWTVQMCFCSELKEKSYNCFIIWVISNSHTLKCAKVLLAIEPLHSQCLSQGPTLLWNTQRL